MQRCSPLELWLWCISIYGRIKLCFHQSLGGLCAFYYSSTYMGFTTPYKTPMVPVMCISASFALERSYENQAVAGLSEMQGTKKGEEGWAAEAGGRRGWWCSGGEDGSNHWLSDGNRAKGLPKHWNLVDSASIPNIERIAIPAPGIHAIPRPQHLFLFSDY